jgi:cell division topological specificity factor
VFEFLTRLFRGESSGAKAKERLRLVLLSDHLALAPDVVESLKTDLLDVISRYVEVDTEHVDVTFEQREHEIAMLASVPILAMKNGRPHAPAAGADAAVGLTAPDAPPASGETVPLGAAAPDESPKDETVAAEAVDAALFAPGGDAAGAQPALVAGAQPKRARGKRRRRRKPTGLPAVASGSEEGAAGQGPTAATST